jgi:drug/metabolite transporter (DMT)-like permease
MQIAESAASERNAATVAALFTTLLLVDSLHFVWARALLPYFDPVVSATGVLVVATVQVGVYGWWTHRLTLASLRRNAVFFAVIGFLVGASTALGYAAMSFVDPGTASMLSKIATLFTIIVGMIWLHDRLTRIQIGGAALSLVGVLIITFQPGDLLRLGSVMVLVGTLCYALHTAVVKRYGDDMDFVEFFFGRLLFTSLALAVFAAMRPLETLATAGVAGWLILILAGTVDVVISRGLFYLALRRLSMSLHAIVLTLSPVATVLWSLLLFDVFPGPRQLLGGFIVIAGVGLAAYFRGR